MKPEIGTYFKMNPKARIKWFVWIVYRDGGIKAIRADHPIALEFFAWLANDRRGVPSFTRPTLEAASKEFWPHHLETAVAA